jgi:hypothetical protein
MEQTQSIPLATVAVQLCCQAYFRVREENPLPLRTSPKYSNIDAQDVHEMASEAYRRNMPLCDSWENIPAFLAAVLQGMVLCVFDPVEASRILYGASVITSRLRPPKESHSAGRPNKSTPLPSGGNHDCGDSSNVSPFSRPSPEAQAKIIQVLTDHGVPVPSEAELRHYPHFAAALFHLGGAYMYQEVERQLKPLPPPEDPPLAEAA